MDRVLSILLHTGAELQLLGLIVSAAGVACSIWLVHEVLPEARAVRTNGPVERLIANVHVRSQVVILFVQSSFCLVSGLVYWLPDVPPTMAVEVHGVYVILVISVRRSLRLAMIVALAAAGFLQARDRRQIFRLLEAGEHRKGPWRA